MKHLHDCELMCINIEDDRIPIGYSPRFREHVLQTIFYCPWCGEQLPQSLRDAYFDQLEPLDLDICSPLSSFPRELRDDTWWRARAL